MGRTSHESIAETAWRVLWDQCQLLRLNFRGIHSTEFVALDLLNQCEETRVVALSVDVAAPVGDACQQSIAA